MTKVLFIIPDYSNKIIDKYATSRVVPYGVLSLATYIDKYCENTKSKIIDFNVINFPQHHLNILKEEIILFEPDIVAISAMYNSCCDQIADFCKIAKGANSKITTVAGGILATNLMDDLFNLTDLLDAASFGEGEIPLRDLLNSESYSDVFCNHRSWVTKSDFTKGKRGKASLVKNLDEIPLLKYDMVDLKKYTSRMASLDGIDKKTLPIHSTRGCPFDCVFCCSGANHGKGTRYMSAERFLKDVKTILEKYEIEKLSIDDDQFLFDSKRAKEILKGLAGFNIEIEMANGLSVKYLDEEMATLLRDAGLKIAVMAIESGSPRVLKDIINKPLTLSQIEPAVKACRKANLLIHTFFIIGFPNETKQDRDASKQLMRDMKFDWNGIFIATPFKGSRLYDICIQNKYIKDFDTTNPNIYQCMITAPGVTPKEITKEAYLMNLDVNFVNNANLLSEKYDIAKMYFSKIARRYPAHAFAHYFLAQSLIKLKEDQLAREHLVEYYKIINKNEQWMEYAKYFKISTEITNGFVS